LRTTARSGTARAAATAPAGETTTHEEKRRPSRSKRKRHENVVLLEMTRENEARIHARTMRLPRRDVVSEQRMLKRDIESIDKHANIDTLIATDMLYPIHSEEK